MTRGWWWPLLLVGCTSFDDSAPSDQAQGGNAGQAQSGAGGQQASGSGGAASAGAGGVAGGAGQAGSAAAGAGSAGGAGQGGAGQAGTGLAGSAQAGAGQAGAGQAGAGQAGSGLAGSGQAGAGLAGAGNAGAGNAGAGNAGAGNAGSGAGQAGSGQAGAGLGGSGQGGSGQAGASGGSAGQSGGGGQAGSGGVVLPGGPRAMWVWDEAEGCLADQSKAQALLDFAAAHQVVSLYLAIRNLLPGQGKNLENFVKTASEKGIAVELLLGDPAPSDKSKTWVLNHAGAIDQVKAIKSTVNGFAGPRPAALHLDIEPHAVPTWDTNKIDFASAYLDLLDKVKVELGGALPVRVDIGHFYTNINVPRNGEQRSFFEWIAGAVDETVLMAYRDHLEGQAGGGVLDLIADEFADPSLEARLVVGLETDCLGITNNNITFCEEGNAQLESVMAGIRKVHEKSPLFYGFAIHHFTSYQTLPLPLPFPLPLPSSPALSLRPASFAGPQE